MTVTTESNLTTVTVRATPIGANGVPRSRGSAALVWRKGYLASQLEGKMQSVGKLVGLTGGIAAGKSTVSSMLSSLGARVIDADEIARAVVSPGTPAMAQIAETFGPTAIKSDGHLNRSWIASQIFSDPSLRQKLNAIVHPKIAARSRELLGHALANHPGLVVYDAALLVENDLAEAFRPLIVVTTTPALQLQRLMSRDGLSKEQAEQRVQAQMPLQDKEQVADHIIRNDSSLRDLKGRVNTLHSKLCAEGK